MAFLAAAHIGASSTSATCAKPTGVADNDFMLAIVKRSESDGIDPTTVPSGWTQIGKQVTSGALTATRWLYWKLAASEGADYNWAWAASVRTAISIAAYRGGFDTADPIDVVSNTPHYTTSNTTARAASMSVTAPNSTLIFVGCVHDSSTQSFTAPTVPASFTEDVDYWETDGREARCFASLVWGSSGATGDMDATSTLTTTNKAAFAVALNPAAAGASRVNLLAGKLGFPFTGKL